MSIREVYPYLYVSDYSNAERYGPSFDLVVNCTDNLMNVSNNCIRISVQDDVLEQDKMYEFWDRYMYFIDECIRKEGRVLIHCFGGVSRSASTAVAYMIYKSPSRDIMSCVKEVMERKPDTFMTRDLNFYDALVRYQQKCIESRSSIDC